MNIRKTEHCAGLSHVDDVRQLCLLGVGQSKSEVRKLELWFCSRPAARGETEVPVIWAAGSELTQMENCGNQFFTAPINTWKFMALKRKLQCSSFTATLVMLPCRHHDTNSQYWLCCLSCIITHNWLSLVMLPVYIMTHKSGMLSCMHWHTNDQLWLFCPAYFMTHECPLWWEYHRY